MFSFAVSQGKAADLSELDLKVRSIPVALRIRERRCRNRRQPPCLCRLVGRLLRLPRGPTWTTRSPGSPRGQRTPGTSGEKRSRRLPSMTPSLLFNHDITPPVMWGLGGGTWCRTETDAPLCHYRGRQEQPELKGPLEPTGERRVCAVA